MKMRTARETEVLILGAGPVGMYAALRLAESGIRVSIVDKYRRSALHSYALALHPRTVTLLDELGVAEPLIERGQRVDRIVIHDNESCVAELELSGVGGAFPFVLVASQPLLEGALESRLAQNGVQVLWSHQALTFDSDEDGVTALLGRLPTEGDPRSVVEPGEVSTSRVRASFLIAADGTDSLGRRTLGVQCTNVGNQICYALLEFQSRMEAPDEMNLVLRDESTDVLWPLGPDRGRWSVQLPDLSESPDAESLKERIRRHSPWFRNDLGAVDWLTTVSFQPCLAKRFGRGRVWLAGDAAHFTSPIGVQSMNVGIREASDLVRRITRILRENRPLDLLRYYNEERNREWKMLLGITDRLRERPGAPPWARRLATRLIPALPASGRDLNALLEQVGLRLDWLRRKT